MKQRTWKYSFPLFLAATLTVTWFFLLVPLSVLAQEGKMGAMESMCPMCGGGGIVIGILGGLLLVAATAALIALAVFLIRRSRT